MGESTASNAAASQEVRSGPGAPSVVLFEPHPARRTAAQSTAVAASGRWVPRVMRSRLRMGSYALDAVRGAAGRGRSDGAPRETSVTAEAPRTLNCHWGEPSSDHLRGTAPRSRARRSDNGGGMVAERVRHLAAGVAFAATALACAAGRSPTAEPGIT